MLRGDRRDRVTEAVVRNRDRPHVLDGRSILCHGINGSGLIARVRIDAKGTVDGLVEVFVQHDHVQLARIVERRIDGAVCFVAHTGINTDIAES